MTERYSGVKFRTIFVEKKAISNTHIPDLIRWCKKFANLCLAPAVSGGYAGNLSYRTDNGFVITRSGADLNQISKKDLVEVMVTDIQKKEVQVRGLFEPSSESILHSEIYKKRQEINAVFHGHDKDVLCKSANLPITQSEKPYGSIELVHEVIRILDNHDYILIKNHGFISLGITMKSAGERALAEHKKALSCD